MTITVGGYLAPYTDIIRFAEQHGLSLPPPHHPPQATSGGPQGHAVPLVPTVEETTRLLESLKWFESWIRGIRLYMYTIPINYPGPQKKSRQNPSPPSSYLHRRSYSSSSSSTTSDYDSDSDHSSSSFSRPPLADRDPESDSDSDFDSDIEKDVEQVYEYEPEFDPKPMILLVRSEIEDDPRLDPDFEFKETATDKQIKNWLMEGGLGDMEFVTMKDPFRHWLEWW